MKNEPQDEQLPRKFTERIYQGTRLCQIPDLKTFI